MEHEIKTTKWLIFSILWIKGKTKVYGVFNKNSEMIGKVEWYNHWRQYVYISERDIVLAKSCLDEISIFIKELMEERKLDHG